jgi:prepilin-type N-terminal cleavage/methylation domain-containing protein
MKREIHKLRSGGGFTLVELMVTVSILVILAAIAIPNLSNFLNSGKFSSATGELNVALRVAQSEALKRGRYVSLRSAGNTSSTFAQGWVIFVDSNPPTGVVPAAASDIILTQGPLSTDVRIQLFTSNVGVTDLSVISFSPNGTTELIGNRAAAAGRFVTRLVRGSSNVLVGTTCLDWRGRSRFVKDSILTNGACAAI